MRTSKLIHLFAMSALLLVPRGLAQQTATPPTTTPSQPAAAPAQAVRASTFRITLDPSLFSEPYTGRVYVALAGESVRGEPRQSMGEWGGGAQVLAIPVERMPPGGVINVDATALGCPNSYADIKPGRYRAQAIVKRNPDSPNPGRGPGDLSSKPVLVDFTPGTGDVVEFTPTEVVKERPFRETDRIKLVEIKSDKLSAFYGREVKARAGVYLPKNWVDDPTKSYPTIYFITGFGGDHKSIAFMSQMIPSDGSADDVMLVVPDPLCELGHSVFADSANNGPRGASLMEELIPEVEHRFHGAKDASRRYVTGISSGGWGSLWLAVAYPDAWAGCWSHYPDPVDFRDFQRINLYADHANMYRDEKGERRPLARHGEVVSLWYDDFVRQETVMGPGGQIHSFEAVFSPRGPDGKPLPLFDRATGNVDPKVAKTWEPYDIRLVIERNWKTLGPKLAGKLHIYAGEVDTFYLEGAVKLLQKSLSDLGSDAEVVVVAGMNHTMYPGGLQSMFKEIAERHAKDK